MISDEDLDKLSENINNSITYSDFQAATCVSNFFKNIDNFTVFEDLIIRTASDTQLSFAVADHFRVFFETSRSKVKSSDIMQVFDWIFEILLSKDNQLPMVSVNQLVAIFGIVISQEVTLLNNEYLEKLDRIYEFFNGYPRETEIGLSICNQTLDACKNEDFHNKKGFLIKIRGLFNSSIDSIGWVMNGSIIENAKEIITSALQVCDKCFRFILPEDDGKSNRGSCINFGPETADLFNSIEIVNLFYDVFQAYGTVEAIYCLIDVVSANRSDQSADFKNIMTRVFDGLRKLSNDAEHVFKNLEYIGLVLNACSSKINSSRVMAQIETFMPFFIEFGDRLVDMLEHSCQNEAPRFTLSQPETFQNSIKFFSDTTLTLQAETGNTAERVTVFEVSAKVNISYIKFVLTSITFDNSGDKDIWLPNCKVSSVLTPISKMFFTDVEQIVNIIMEWALKLREDLEASPTIETQRQLGVLIQIIIPILNLRTVIDSRSLSLSNYHLHLFDLCMNFMEITANLNDEISLLENCIVIFINETQNFSFIKIESRRKQLLSSLKQIERPINTMADLQNYIVNRLLIALRKFPSEEIIVSAANSCLPMFANIKGFVEEIVRDPQIPYLETHDLLKQRVDFYAKISEIIFKKPEYEPLIAYVFERFQSLIDSRDAVGLAFDLRGFFSTIHRSSQYLIVLDWFLNNASEFFINTIEESVSDDALIVEVYSPILKLYSIICENRPKGRIVFPQNVATGVRLFQAAAYVMAPALAKMDEDNILSIDEGSLYPLRLRPLLYILQTTERLISGGYVLLDAFIIYGNSTFQDLITRAILSIRAISYESLSGYTRVLAAASDLLIAISRRHLPLLLTCGSEYIEFTLQFAQCLLDNENGPKDQSYELIMMVCRFLTDFTLIGSTSQVDEFKPLLASITRSVWQQFLKGKAPIHSLAPALQNLLLIDPASLNVVHDAYIAASSEDVAPMFLSTWDIFTSNIFKALESASSAFYDKLVVLDKFTRTRGYQIILPITEE